VRALHHFAIWAAIIAIAIVCAFAIRSQLPVYSKSHWPNPRFDTIGAIKSALGQYQVDIGRFPESLQALVKRPPNATNWHGPYLDPPVVPVDPWGKTFAYRCPGQHNPGTYDLLSAGPDGKVGTSDDIGNWTN
jgi:general secretion pathway protein G